MNPSDFIPTTHPSPMDMASKSDAQPASAHPQIVAAFARGIAAERRRLRDLLITAATALLAASKDAGATPDGFRAQGAAEALVALGTGLS